MKKKLMTIKHLGLLVITLVFSNNSLANVITIDFEDPSLVGQYYLDGELVSITPIQIGTLGSNGAADIIAPPFSYTSGPNEGSSYLHSSTFSSIFIQANQSDFFSLVSLDIGEYSSYVSNDSVTITGFKSSGDQVSTTFQLDEVFDGIGGINDFQLITLDANWTNLTRVELDSSAYSLDNIQIDLNPIPVPAALWLFISGSIGLLSFSKIHSKKMLLQ